MVEHLTRDSGGLGSNPGLVAYQNYIVSAAESMLVSAAASSTGFAEVYPTGLTKPTGRNYTDNAGDLGSIGVGDSKQIQVRSLYLDPLSSGAAQAILALKNSGQDWLDKIPMTEVNTTLLSEWEVSSDAVFSNKFLIYSFKYSFVFCF